MRFDDLAVGPAPQLPRAAYEGRRKRLAAALGHGEALVVATHPTHQFSNDVDYVFRPHSDFWYLTGFAEPGAVLVLEGGTGNSTLLLRDRKPEAEIWTGRRLGVGRASDALGVDRAYDIADVAARLPALLAGKRVHAIARHDPAMQRRITTAARGRLVRDPAHDRPGGPRGLKATKGKERAAAKEGTGGAARKGRAAGAGPARATPRPPAPHARQLLHEMRLVKEPAELRMLRQACDLGVESHLAALHEVRPGAREFQVEAAFAHAARHAGSTGCGYPSICGCGPNAAVLHYVANLDALRKGELFLIDAGCEWGYYTSDITRTYPVGGSFGRRELELYELVEEAHRKAVKAVRPGVPLRAPHEKAVEVLATGLLDLGMLQGSVERVIESQSYRRFFMHGTSHWLGLDVHDAGGQLGADGKPRLLQEGMVLTVEPGLYFNADYTACPPGTKGIGIRIEDDIAVSSGGARNLTRALPVEPSDLEGLLPRRQGK